MMKRIAVVLMALCIITPCVSAGIIEDAISLIFPQDSNFSENGKTVITAQSIGENEISVSYSNTLYNPNGTTIQLYCLDNTGRAVPVWGGSVVVASGSFSFTKDDALLESTNGCQFGIDYGGDLV